MRDQKDRGEQNPIECPPHFTATRFREGNGGDKARSGTSSSGSTIPRLLNMEMQDEPGRRRTKTYNRDAKVADYRDGEEVLELMMGD